MRQFVRGCSAQAEHCTYLPVADEDRGSYRRHDDSYETAQLEALIDGRLLGVYDGPGHQRLARIRAELGMT